MSGSVVSLDTLVGITIDGRYRLASPVGAGTYGCVFAADEIAFGEVIGQVAVKLLRPPDDEAGAAIVREVQAMRQLTHPNLLTCYAAGVASDGIASGCLFIASELASHTLAGRLRLPDRMPLDEVLELAEHIASALGYLADRGAVHRDVKPANILRIRDTWKLGDFGLMRGFAGSAVQASGCKGTVLYMSPEAMSGETGPFVDVWALGVVLQECLTGGHPYTGGSDAEVIAAALTTEPYVAPDLPAPLDTVVQGCLAKERSRRWTARAVVAQLGGSGASDHWDVGKSLYAQGQYPEAEEAFRSAVILDGAVARYHRDLGRVLLRQRKFAEAEAEFRTAVRLDGTVAKYHDDLGRALLVQHKYAAAQVAFAEAIELHGTAALYHAHLGDALIRQEDYGAAGLAYKSAIGLDDSVARYHEGLGLVLLRLGMNADAEGAYRAAIRLGGTMARCHGGLAETLLAQRKYGEAEAAARTAVHLDEDEAGYHFLLGDALAEQGLAAEGESAYRRAIELDGTVADYYDHLGYLMARQGRNDDALEAFRRSRELHETADG